MTKMQANPAFELDEDCIHGTEHAEYFSEGISVCRDRSPVCIPVIEPQFPVTVAQIREFIDNPRFAHIDRERGKILDFIDNGPKKPTAEETIRSAMAYAAGGYVGNPKKIATALREAGYLTE